MKHYLILLFALLCSACIQLGGEPAQTRYYLLEPMSASTPTTAACQIQLRFDPVEFPGYLDRPQLVSRSQDNSILLAKLDRWAEPLSDNLQRTVLENLRRQLAGLQIEPRTTGHCSYRVKLQVNRFDGILGQQLAVNIRWALLASDGSVLTRDQFLDQRPIGTGYQQLVNGLNAALADLSEQLGTALLNRQELK